MRSYVSEFGHQDSGSTSCLSSFGRNWNFWVQRPARPWMHELLPRSVWEHVLPALFTQCRARLTLVYFSTEGCISLESISEVAAAGELALYFLCRQYKQMSWCYQPLMPRGIAFLLPAACDHCSARLKCNTAGTERLTLQRLSLLGNLTCVSCPIAFKGRIACIIIAKKSQACQIGCWSHTV